MTKDDLKAILVRNKHVTINENQVNGLVQNAIAKPKFQRTLERSVSRATTSLGRATIRFIGYRVRPCDPDNFAGSVKHLLDGLRHANIILGDEPCKIILQTEQVKVSKKSQERTEIEIELPITIDPDVRKGGGEINVKHRRYGRLKL